MLLCRWAIVAATAAVSGHAADRPNILWLISEDHGPEMGCYGDANARTPHVDALAAQGLRFKRAWSVNPVCAPARTTIISGLYPESAGTLHMRSMVPLPEGMRLFPEYLREVGYYCSNNAKEDYNLPKSEKVWDESSPQAHWRKRATQQPFFAVFNSMKSHESRIRTRPHRAIADPAQMRVPAYHPDTPAVRQDWAQYYDRVSEADADAGARLREIEAAGLAADTIVFYFGDHGSGMPRSKRWPSNSGLHVPMVVYFPEKWRHLAPKEYRPGGASDRLVSFVDLAPSVLSIAGIAPPGWMHGVAFAGPHRGTPPSYLFGSRGRMDERHDVVRSVTDGRYVYLRNYFPHVSQGQHVGFQFQTPTTREWHERYLRGETNAVQSLFWQTPKPPEELYDLETDRDEVRNLADEPEHRATLERLRAALREHAASIRDVCFLPEGELHSRAPGRSPHDLARGDDFPFERIRATAELASNLDPAALPELEKRLRDPDSAVRYWAAMGFLMRGRNAASGGETVLRTALRDASGHVRIAAAHALAAHGGEADTLPALAVLRDVIAAESPDVFLCISALNAIDSLGAKAAVLRPEVQQMKAARLPHERYDGYIARLTTVIADAPQSESGAAALRP